VWQLDACSGAVPDPLPAELLRACRAAWPGLALGDERFAEHVARHRPDGAPAAGWLSTECAADLFLACACATGVPGAVERFEQAFLSRVPAFLARQRASPELVDEVKQALRERLLVATGGAPPRIAEYSGRGALGRWLQVATVRTAINLRAARRAHDPSGAAELAAAGDLELDHIKERYRQPLTDALQAAIAHLTSEQRNLLRLHFLDGATLDQLADSFKVHRATIARQLAAARESIVDEARRTLERSLRLTADEFDSLLGLLRSQLDLSVTRLLQKSQ
jgi:RNA polymerase sigma-70 factor (ECF subfamily)